MSDLFGNHIVGFPTRWLTCVKKPVGKQLTGTRLTISVADRLFIFFHLGV